MQPGAEGAELGAGGSASPALHGQSSLANGMENAADKLLAVLGGGWKCLYFTSLYKYLIPFIPWPQGCFYLTHFPLALATVRACLNYLQSAFSKQYA